MNNDNKGYILRSKTEAVDWESEYFPIGNSKNGITISGGAGIDRLVLNDKTLWIGGPSPDREYNGGNRKGASLFVKEAQQALREKDYERLDKALLQLTGLSEGYGAYQTLGCFIIESDIGELDNYERTLDISRAVAGVKLTSNGLKYEREYFASFPDNIMAVKYSCSEKALNLRLKYEGAPDGASVIFSEDGLEIKGELADNGLRYSGRIHVVTDGEASFGEGEYTLSSAGFCQMYIVASTDYKNEYPHYRSGENPSEATKAVISKGIEKGYDAIFNAHISDYKSIFDKASVSFNGVDNSLTTYELLEKFKADEADENARWLIEMFFAYGRYLLISSSRDGDLPSNLQGVWNNTNTPPWACDYHINVNLQMNYWHAYVTNLFETVPPLVDFLDAMRAPGRVTAAEYYGISSSENDKIGWIAHTQATPFGHTCPGWDFYWGWSTAAVAWLCQNIYEYFEFSNDIGYLEEKIYPILEECASFYTKWLIYDEGQNRYVSSPSYSPEHGPVTIGNTYEQSLIEQFYIDFLAASKALGISNELTKKAGEQLPLLKPYAVSKNGMLKEWFEEDDEDFDRSKIQKHHRHTSHLLGLYPGKQIVPEKTELMAAAKASMNDRGDESTGWSRAHKACLWSRVPDGERAFEIFSGLLKSCVFPNLWDFHPPFQIDGNFGGTAALAELLIQSHRGYIELLPALPGVLKNGEFSGLCARGGFEVSARWENGKVISAEIVSRKDEVCKIKLDDCMKPEGVEYEISDGIAVFKCRAGVKCKMTKQR